MPGSDVTCDLRSDRQTDLCLSSTGDSLFLLVDEAETFCFDLKSYRFGAIDKAAYLACKGLCGQMQRLPFDHEENRYTYRDTYGTLWSVQPDGRICCQDAASHEWQRCEDAGFDKLSNLLDVQADSQNNLWAIDKYGIYKIELFESHYEVFPQEQEAQIRAFMQDHLQRYWVSSYEDQTLRVFSPDNRLVGYLAPDGTLRPSYTRLGASAYCMHESANGRIWIATESGGVNRL